MAKSAEDFVDYIRESDYPSVSETTIVRAFNEAVVDCNNAAPAIRTGQFNVVSSQTTYDVFNRANSTPPPPELVDANGFRAIQVTWSIQPDHSSDPFFQGPFLGPYNGRPIVPFSTTTMWRPSDAIIFESDLAAVHDEFFNSMFENLDSDPKSPIVLTPAPGADGIAGIKYAAYRDVSEYLERAETAYTYFAESRVCRALARTKARTAGIKLGPVQEDPSSMKFWTGEAERLYKMGQYFLERAHFSEIPAAQRGGVGGG